MASNQEILRAAQEMGKLQIISVELPAPKAKFRSGDRVTVEGYTGEWTVTSVDGDDLGIEQYRRSSDGGAYAAGFVNVKERAVEVVS